MTNTVLLDNVKHHDLRVRTGHSAAFGDAVNLALVFPTEFVFVQREYPILFQKDEGGSFQAVALLGLDRGENLFLDEQGWQARYVPAVQQRGPFLVGLHRDEAGDQAAEPMVHVNLDHPRISRSEGEPLFLKHGGHSPYLQQVTRVLQLIVQGADLARPMFEAFAAEGLLESMEVKVSIDERTQYALPDFFTIDAERLASLDGAALKRLHDPGYLNLAHMVVNSLGNIEWLIALKNRRRSDQPA